MKTCSLSHLADHVLLRDLKSLVARDRVTTAELLAHLGEADERRLYAPAAYPSMYLYCVHELRMSEDTALKRIRVARAARKFPAILAAVADGRLHLGAVVLLAPHLTEETAEGLFAAASHRTKAAIELMLAERFPRPDMPTFVQALAASSASDGLAPGPVDATTLQLAPGPVVPSHECTLGIRMDAAGPRTKLAPLARGRFALQVTVDQATFDQLRYAQSLLGHAVPSGDVGQVLKRALDALVHELERRKFAKCARTRPQRSAANGRYVPADIRRAVSERDGSQCTFVSDQGQRCPACTRLEFDHVVALARGGETSTVNLRLRCRAHNQHSAERDFGAGFMEQKRREARLRTAQTRDEAAKKVMVVTATIAGPAPRHVDARARRDEVIPWLRKLGFRVDEAQRGAAMCDGMTDAPLKDRVRVALSGLGREGLRGTMHTASTAGHRLTPPGPPS